MNDGGNLTRCLFVSPDLFVLEGFPKSGLGLVLVLSRTPSFTHCRNFGFIDDMI